MPFATVSATFRQRPNAKLWPHTNFEAGTPGHPSLQFKRVHRTDPIYSVRIGRTWRALGFQRDPERMLWFWIGSHADYDRLLQQL